MAIIPRELLAALLVLLAALGLTYRCASDRAWDRAELRIRSVALERDALEAAADTTRLLYADSVQAVARRVVQAEQERDRLDDALGWERRTTATLLVAIRELRESTSATVTVDSADVRYSSFHWRGEPFTLDLDVAVPPPPDSATADIRIALDPLTLTARVGCGARRDGVRPASVAVEGPSWARIHLERAFAAADVCNPIVPAGPSRTRWFVGGAAAGTLITLILLRSI